MVTLLNMGLHMVAAAKLRMMAASIDRRSSSTSTSPLEAMSISMLTPARPISPPKSWQARETSR